MSHNFNTIIDDDTTKVKIIKTEYYKGYGALFTKNYELFLNVDDYPNRFTPSLEEINLVEQIFIAQYNQIHLEDSRVIKFKPLKNVRKHFNKYYRQYIGFSNEKGERIIEIRLLNFSKGMVKRKLFKDWMIDVVVGLGDSYYENMSIMRVNLIAKKLYIH